MTLSRTATVTHSVSILFYNYMNLYSSDQLFKFSTVHRIAITNSHSLLFYNNIFYTFRNYIIGILYNLN